MNVKFKLRSGKISEKVLCYAPEMVYLVLKCEKVLKESHHTEMNAVSPFCLWTLRLNDF